MLTTDIHTHTLHAHGANTVQEMFNQGKSFGLKVLGFSEHSPRPLGYDYSNEYREQLQKMLPTYVKEVKELQQSQDDIKILFGMEVDWLENEFDFVKKTVEMYDFDYLIGGIHFLGTWGFDADAKTWESLLYPQKAQFFEAYYLTMQKMIESRFFQTIAHPDLIKIFAKDDFKTWLKEKNSIALVRQTMQKAKEYNIAVEVSTAGLRKACKEIYPCEELMEIITEYAIPITLASDGHCVNTLCAYYDELEEYLKKFNIQSYVYFEKGHMVKVEIE